MADTPTYAELMAQRAELDKQIEQARAAALTGAIDNVRKIIAEFDLTEADIFGRKRAGASDSAVKRSVAPKYRNPATGATWSGRGKPPTWIAGKDRAEFEISPSEAAA